MLKIPHLTLLFITALSIFILCKTHYIEKLTKHYKLLSLLTLLFDPIYWIWEYNNFGRFDFATSLPIYICSLFWMLFPIVAFSKNEFIKRSTTACMCTICLVGGFMGLVFNVYLNRYPFFSFVPMRSLLYHIMMILIPVSMWESGYYTPRKNDEFLCFIPFVILFIPAFILNKLFGWDYFYTAGGIGTPFEKMSVIMPRCFFPLVLYILMFFFIRRLFYKNKILDKHIDNIEKVRSIN